MIRGSRRDDTLTALSESHNVNADFRVSTQLLTPAQVCAKLAISRKTLQRMCQNSHLSFLRVNGSYRFRETAIELYITRQERIAKP